MSCCKNEKKTVVMLSFKREELLYDAENYSFIEGDIMKTDDEHVRHQVIDIGQDGNVNRVTRVLSLAHSECVELLFPYTKEDVRNENCALDDTLKEPDTYDIILLLPRNFSMTTIRLLKDLIHEYLVCRVLADWMSITNPSSQRNWEDKLASLKMKIQTSLMSRGGKIRRKLKPF